MTIDTDESAGAPAETDARSVTEASGDEPDPLIELRALLIGPERHRLQALEDRLDDPETHARELSDVLPQAIGRADDPSLSTALGPSVERAITASVRRNPRPLAEALFPVIGPAIRKAIAHSLSAMIESLNRSLEHSLSWQALQWRLTALRTGKSFAEVVLLNTLVYRVEQVFLIERKSGLLLQHVATESTTVRDADMVSGMLTAIRDFVQDSFKVRDHESLEMLQVGELSVWIEQGPFAVVAAVIRGTAPKELRLTLQNALETIHLQQAELFDSYTGDSAMFDEARPTLEACLQAQYRTDRKARSAAVRLAAAALIVLVGIWAASTWRERSRWNRYLGALRAEPGIVLVNAGRSGGRYTVTGLRDPLAADPRAILEQAGFKPDEVVGRWDLYQALDPSFVLQRARTVLQPPEGVTLAFTGGTLSVSGAAPSRWIEEADRLARVLPGVSRLDRTSLSNADLDRVIQQIESTSILFVKGATEPVLGSDEMLRRIRAQVAELDDFARSSSSRFRVSIVGHSDADGAPAANLPLSRGRAERIAAALAGMPLAAITLVAVGVGSDDPDSSGQSETDKQQNRRVSFRLERAGAAGVEQRQP